MTKKPHQDTRLAKYIERRVLELKPKKSQLQIANEAGFANPSALLGASASPDLAFAREVPLHDPARAEMILRQQCSYMAISGNSHDREYTTGTNPPCETGTIAYLYDNGCR